MVRRSACPTCNADLGNWDVAAAPRNVVLAGLVEGLGRACLVVSHGRCFAMLRQKRSGVLCHLTRVEGAVGGQPHAVAPPQNLWSGSLSPASGPLYELQLRLTNSLFVTKPSLFVAVVDRSGSMSGGPWRLLLGYFCLFPLLKAFALKTGAGSADAHSRYLGSSFSCSQLMALLHRAGAVQPHGQGEQS